MMLDGYPVKRCLECGCKMKSKVSILYCPVCHPEDGE